MVEKKWCVSCQASRPSVDFRLVRVGKTNRWKCGICLKREAAKTYEGKKNAK
jgi:hypothetical protein